MSVINLDFSLTSNTQTKVCNIPVSTKYMFYAFGTFGGGCLSLEASPDGGVNWFTVDQLSGAGRLIRHLVNGEKVRISLIGATSPNITAGLRQ